MMATSGSPRTRLRRRKAPWVALSVPWSSPWVEASAPDVDQRARRFVRRVDWQVTPARKMLLVVRDAWGFFLRSRGAAAAVVCTTSVDAVAVAVLMLLRPRQVFVVYDYLLPRSARGRSVSRLVLRRVDLWVVIRRGDVEIFKREVGARRCAWVPFPAANAPPAGARPPGPPFVYAAGTAHRDWPTLVAAATRENIRTLISTIDEVTVPPGSPVEVRPLVTAEEGRRLIAAAVVVCVPILPTDLPAGPLVVLDALTAGRAVVATDANGTRDYIVNGVTGILVRPSDADALASALREIVSNDKLRMAMEEAARDSSTAFTGRAVLRKLVEVSLEQAARAPRHE